MRFFLPRALYGIFFVAAVPLLLALWADSSGNAVQLPAVHEPLWGALLAACGVIVLLVGMAALWRDGGGLPMNAFPPPRFVARGIYALLPHPIYGGFVLACAGVSIACGSASGLWLVTPCVALACAALVLGYEVPDLRKRFGALSDSLWLPRDRSGPPSLLERLRLYPVLLLPWLALFELIGALGKAPDAVSPYLPFEHGLPVIEQAEPLYASTYLIVLLAPLLIASGSALRRFAQYGLRAMALIFPLYLLLPIYVPPRAFTPSTFFAPMLLWERVPASGIGAFPSYHVVWAMIAAAALGQGSRVRKLCWWTWAALVALSCIATGMHSIADVAAGVAVFALVVYLPNLWRYLLRIAERIANSWRELRLGPVRIINHGGYAALATLVGLSIIDTLLGPGRTLLTAAIFVFIIVGAALWAQWVEGSPALLRPMGFYGGMIGAMLGAATALFMGVNLWVAFAAVCVAAPWIQGIGRLRCLVQGCCHGRATEAVPGICYHHPRTRVCRLAHLAGVPVHATQVYSILCNLVVGLFLLRLLQLHVACSVLCGVYLLLSSAGRFVEEAYRGEPQTQTIRGLHLYQWIALESAVMGAAMTCASSPPLPQIHGLRLSTFLLASLCAAAAWFVTGVDFPESSRRFARLT
jgi:protein-S-isoprenylcysteine O-methyltransferase Ste14